MMGLNEPERKEIPDDFLKISSLLRSMRNNTLAKAKEFGGTLFLSIGKQESCQKNMNRG